MNLGAPELLIVFFLALWIVPGAWTAYDASRYPEWAFQRARSNRVLWIAGPIVSIFLCWIITIVAAVAWFSSVKPKVVSAAHGYPPNVLGARAVGARSGWYPDPTHRHEYRYFDGTTWTEHVADHGERGEDPL